MSYNGSGTFAINTSGQPVVTGTIISSTAFNSLTADLATGLSTAITKDGQTSTTVRIPFAQGINSTLVTDSTSTSTGSIITAGGVGIAKSLYTLNFSLTGTGASKLNVGTTGERPTAATGMVRFNSTTGRFEGYGASSWGALGGGATGGGNDQIFIENGQTVTADYTITASNNAGTFGPVSIDSGVTVTVPTGSVWTVI